MYTINVHVLCECARHERTYLCCIPGTASSNISALSTGLAKILSAALCTAAGPRLLPAGTIAAAPALLEPAPVQDSGHANESNGTYWGPKHNKKSNTGYYIYRLHP